MKAMAESVIISSAHLQKWNWGNICTGFLHGNWQSELCILSRDSCFPGKSTNFLFPHSLISPQPRMWTSVDFSRQIAPESDTNAQVIALDDALIIKHFNATANESPAKCQASAANSFSLKYHIWFSWLLKCVFIFIIKIYIKQWKR